MSRCALPNKTRHVCPQACTPGARRTQLRWQLLRRCRRPSGTPPPTRWRRRPHPCTATGGLWTWAPWLVRGRPRTARSAHMRGRRRPPVAMRSAAALDILCWTVRSYACRVRPCCPQAQFCRQGVAALTRAGRLKAWPRTVNRCWSPGCGSIPCRAALQGCAPAAYRLLNNTKTSSSFTSAWEERLQATSCPGFSTLGLCGVRMFTGAPCTVL